MERKFPGPAGLLPEIPNFKIGVEQFRELKRKNEEIHVSNEEET